MQQGRVHFPFLAFFLFFFSSGFLISSFLFISLSEGLIHLFGQDRGCSWDQRLAS